MTFIDARWQIEAAPDEHTELRSPTRASESAQPSSERPCLRPCATALSRWVPISARSELSRSQPLTPNIRVLDAPRRARMLAVDPGRLGALLEKAGLVQHQD